jgi:hypothetical protein
MSSQQLPMIPLTRDINLSNPYKFLLYGLPGISYISFIIIFILTILIKFNNKNVYVVSRTILFFIFFICSFNGFYYNFGLFKSIEIANNKDKTTIINNNIFKINSIVLAIIVCISILYLISSVTLGCS